jgi:hypothetical protein
MSSFSRGLIGVTAASGLILASLSAQGPTSNNWLTPPIPLNTLSSSSYDASIAYCLGGTQAWITSQRPGGPGGYDIYWATRANSQGAWSVPVLSALSSTGADYFADITEDGTEIVYSFNAAAGGGISDLMIATRTNVVADFAANSAVLIPGANTASDEGDPSFSNNNLELYFQSDRAPGAQNAIWKVSRASRTSPFGSPVMVSDTANLDHSPAISASNNYLYHSVFLGGNNSDYHGLYRATDASAFTAPAVIAEWTNINWDANGQFERADSVFALVSLHTPWGGLPSSSVYESPRLVPGLAADRDSVSGATGGPFSITSCDTSATGSNTFGFHLHLMALSTLPGAVPVPGVVGELFLNPSPMFVINSGPTGPSDGYLTTTLNVPAGTPAGGRLHFQAVFVDLVTLALALSTHESVGIN